MPQEFPSIPYLGPAAARYGNYNKRYMVVHCTSNNAPPVNECKYAMNRTDGVGLHFCSDPSTVLQGLESWYGTGHVGSNVGNQYGIAWEFVGYTSSSTSYYQSCIDRAVDSIRLVMDKWGIPYRWLSDNELRAGNVKGLVTHEQCSRVLGGSNHTDPGPNFPRQYLIDALEDDMADISATETPNAWTEALRVDGLVNMADEIIVDWGTGPQVQQNKLAQFLKAMAESLEELHEKVDALSTGTGHTIEAIEDAAFRGSQRAEQE